ncbi:MAG TPA: UDP-N-acetylmuramate dehydrogenase [Candidatus Fimenecus excrementigallinarum]|uniref:UDP-N-acetylenolpyruvoylglucosamine reductase n=1 Tax=Candidatus Fimenecus excrementigallinarum TaxID=2840816 RepID=A0A9D1LDC8_9FIRM|nr:UDP-N-acetylmuramate dehydrogenase [Candidatus Fimenecus excrementigallinarum]
MSETEGFAVFDAVLKAARRHGVRWETDYPMRKLTTFRTGGPASLLVQPNSEGALQDILQAALSENIPYCVIGNGSNLLVSDEGFCGLVIRIGAEMSGIEELGGGRLRVEAGASMSTLCNAACKLGLSGLEFAFGIPGTAGGAAVMNAGAYGGEMRDVLLSCDHLDSRGNPGAFTGEALDLSYRHSAYSAGGYILTALTLRLMPDSTQAIRARMEENLRRRKEKQPLDFPSAGSTFKRPEGHFAGALIEQCGLKGCRIGGAQVSEKHAGFIINAQEATSADIAALIAFVRQRVLEETGVLLSPEVKWIGPLPESGDAALWNS